jgi:nitronate monooxygenase
MSPREQLRALLPLRHPVVLAPMAGVSGGALARAVSAAGGFGLIGGGYGDRSWLAEQLRLCEGVPFGVGFITWSLRRQPALLQQALDGGARAIMLSFAPIGEFARTVREHGAVLLAQVQTVAQAREAVAAGAQVIVAQGAEGGGHSGVRGTLALVPAVADAVDVPVLAAGGIADARGLAAALALGAAGVLCGTVFYAAEESHAHAQAKARLVQASGDDTVKSALYDVLRDLDWPPGPWSLRTLRNPFAQRWAAVGPQELQQAMHGLRERFEAARAAGDFDVAPVIAGEAADLVRAVRPAGEIVREMAVGCAALLQQLGAAPD